MPSKTTTYQSCRTCACKKPMNLQTTIMPVDYRTAARVNIGRLNYQVRFRVPRMVIPNVTCCRLPINEQDLLKPLEHIGHHQAINLAQSPATGRPLSNLL